MYMYIHILRAAQVKPMSRYNYQLLFAKEVHTPSYKGVSSWEGT